MSVLKPTRLQSKQILATVLNYLNQSFWNCWKWAVFLWSFGWLWPAGEGEQSQGFDDGVCPVPISSPSPVVKTPTPSSFHPRPLLRVMVLSQLSHTLQRGCLAPRGLAQAGHQGCRGESIAP